MIRRFWARWHPGISANRRVCRLGRPGATVKEYGLDSEVLYRDSLDNQFTSDPLKVNVEVVPAQSVVTRSVSRGMIAIILTVLAIAGYVIYIKRFKPQ